MYRVYIWGFSDLIDRNAILDLQTLGKIEILEWISSASPKGLNIYEFFNGTWSNPKYNKTFMEPDMELFPQFCDQQARYDKMYVDEGNDYNKLLHLYRMYYNYFLRRLSELKPDWILMSEFPHEGADLVLEEVAHELGIKIVMFFQTNLPGRLAYAFHRNELGCLEYIKPLFMDQPKLSLEEEKDRQWSYMKGIDRTIADKRKLVNYKPGWFTNHPDGLVKKKDAEYMRMYTEYESKEPVDFDKPYVYFPLQLQPELTTSGIADKYYDQVTAIEFVRNTIPEDWFIYVKENPKQGFYNRSRAFFERIKAIPNTIVVPLETSSKELMKEAQSTQAVTGTALYEAKLNGYEAVCFGSPWFYDLMHLDTEEEKQTWLNKVNERFPIATLNVEFMWVYNDHDKEKHIANCREAIFRILESYQ